jgi:hypothetical protein
MFDYPGEKIKTIAVILFWINVIISIFLALKAIFEAEFLYFFVFLIGDPLASYISTLFLVAFGELVENISEITGGMKFTTFKVKLEEKEKK